MLIFIQLFTRLMLMKEAGILDVELQHAMPKPTVCVDDSFSKINILDVAPAMILLAIGMLFSLIFLAFEYFRHWRSLKKQKLNKVFGAHYFSNLKEFQTEPNAVKTKIRFADKSNIAPHFLQHRRGKQSGLP
jgi:hypothetical protein